jgi:CubicO group peptidase (beta-lactamase class C family)
MVLVSQKVESLNYKEKPTYGVAMNFRKIFLLSFIIFISTFALLSADENAIIGEWAGSINVPGQELEVVVEFLFEDGHTVGFIDIPLQKAIDLPLENIILQNSNVTFAIKDVPGEPSFNGNFSDDGNTISGEFMQNGATFPFSLIRKSEQEKLDEAAKLEEKLQAIRTFIDSTMSQWHVAGLSVAVVKDNEVLMTEGFGYRDIENKLPVSSQTLFAIGSSSKAFTAFSVGLLVDEGIIDWDTPAREYMPDFKMYDDFATQEMTPIDLLTHRSGLPRHDLMWYGANFSREEMYDRLRYLEPNEPFRYTFQYQNLMYMTAGLMVGRLTNSTWENVVYERVFVPLGMNNSNFSVDASQDSDNYSLPYQVDDNDEIAKMKFMNLSTVGPAGSINSCADDMAQWVRMFLNKGKVDDTQIMLEATIENLITPHMFMSHKSSSKELSYYAYGLGWFIQTYRGHPCIYHGGNIDGFTALVNLLPDDNLGIVILTNQNNSSYSSIAGYYIIDQLLDLEPVDWHGRNLGQQETLAEIEKASETLERVKGTKPSHKLEDYAGVYESRGYGTIQIEQNDDELLIVYHSFASPLEHWHYDVFKPTEGLLADSDILIEFHTNLQGDIFRLSAPFEASVSPIIFEKLPPEKMSDPSYLVQFAGTYELAGIKVSVELNKSGVLMLAYPGQPMYELHPYADNKFQIGDLENYFVEFNFEKKSVIGLSFIQPNGVIHAEKVEESQ